MLPPLIRLETTLQEFSFSTPDDTQVPISAIFLRLPSVEPEHQQRYDSTSNAKYYFGNNRYDIQPVWS